MKIVWPVTLLATLAAAVEDVLGGTDEDCPSGAHFIVAPGLWEQGAGVLGQLVTQVAIDVGDIQVSPLDYTELSDRTTYNESYAYGLKIINEKMHQVVKKCPITPVVLVGYSLVRRTRNTIHVKLWTY